MSDTGNGEAYVFARSGKLSRSPVLSQVAQSDGDATKDTVGKPLELEVSQMLTPKGTTCVLKGDQKDLLLSRSRLGGMKRKVDELYEFIKEKHNVHHKIRALVTGLKAGMIALEQEQQSWRKRVEKAEKELKKRENVSADSVPNERPGKRDRDTPDEEEVSKKQKEDNNDKINKEGESSEWKIIKSKNEKKAEGKTNEKKKEEKKPEKKTEDMKIVKQRPKGEALIVEAKPGTTYAELLRKVRSDPELKELGDNVVKTRRTQRGEMIFELKKDPAVKSSAFKQLVEKSLGEGANVRALCQETMVECRDLDEVTTVDELKNALVAQCGINDDVSLTIRMRRAYGGMQSAVIRVSTHVANKLLEKSKIRVGWSMCPLKALPRATKQMERCFKCMGFGHQAQNCAGPDRSNLCRKCGEEGHIAIDCAKPPKCMLCKRQDGNDHVTGGFNCPMYKKAKALQQ